MKTARPALLMPLLLFIGTFCSAFEHVEIVLDASASMWRGIGGETPRFVAVREAFEDYTAASALRQGRPEVAVRIVGGATPLAGGDWCHDTRLLLPFSIVDSNSCREALADLVPGGGRPLVHGLEAAVADLESVEGGRRIVVVTSGSDQCHRDIIGTLTRIVESTPPIELRIIGLALDQAVANAATLLAPTRNLRSLDSLPAAIEWALQPADTRPAVAQQLEIRLSLDGIPLPTAGIELIDATGAEKAYAAVENGRAQARVSPGRYRAIIEIDGRAPIAVAGLVVDGIETITELDLFGGPPVTLDVDSWTPVAGGTASIAFWGAPREPSWITLAVPGSLANQHLIRAPIAGSRGEVDLYLPDSLTALEARCAIELQPGVFQIVGRQRFSPQEPAVEMDGPDTIETGGQVTISWTGPELEGNHITISALNADDADHMICSPVTQSQGSLTTAAPDEPGRYMVIYRSRFGKILDRRPLEVFEILATIAAPAISAPGDEVKVVWTGPEESHDFVSIARPEESTQDYVRWAPISDGNPLLFRAPSDPGVYEIRYVRSADGSILARQELEVLSAERRLQVPASVIAGSRFVVRWSGTARKGDFLAVAATGAQPREWLDFAFADSESQVSLAAPFEAGLYEIRYISGSTLEIEFSVPLRVR